MAIEFNRRHHGNLCTTTASDTNLGLNEDKLINLCRSKKKNCFHLSKTSRSKCILKEKKKRPAKCQWWNTVVGHYRQSKHASTVCTQRNRYLYNAQPNSMYQRISNIDQRFMEIIPDKNRQMQRYRTNGKQHLPLFARTCRSFGFRSPK